MSDNPSMRDVLLARRQQYDSQEPKIIYMSGTTMAVDYDGDASVLNRPGYVWVRENSQEGGIFQCYSPTVRSSSNLPVIIAHFPTKPMRRMVVNVDWDKMPEVSKNAAPYSIPRHARTHEWPETHPGDDAMYVYPRAIVPFRVTPVLPGVAFSVGRAYYRFNGANVQFPGLSYWDLSDSIPASSGYSRVCLAYLNHTTNEIELAEGMESNSLTALPEYPDLPLVGFPLAYMLLTYGMVRLSESDVLEDARPFFSDMSAVADIDNSVNDKIAWLEHDWDFDFTRHIVNG